MRDYLIFMSDQHNNRVMGCSGDPVIRTPNMDQLSKEGVRFANAYTPCPLCVPARMSMLTSKLPSKTGIFTNNGSSTRCRSSEAAYYGCTEMTDELVGKVRNAFDAYLEKRQRDGIFVYVSDHGDMIGNRGFWGKASLYDDAEHIPFIMAGSGIPEGKTVTCPVSLMDLGPTICAMEGIDAELPEQDGRSLLDVIEGDAGREQPVLAEWMSGQFQNGRDFGRMVVRDNMKLITYHTTGPEADELFCLTDDLWEMHDLREEEPGTAEQLRSFAYANIDVDAVVKQKTAREDGLKLVKAFGRKQHLQNTETWEPTKQQAERPTVFVRTKTPLIPPMQAAWDAGSWAGADPGKAFPETTQ